MSDAYIEMTSSVHAYAAYATDNLIRSFSSSGGVFTVLCDEILNNGGSVFGAAYDDNFSIHHIEVTKVEDLALLRGAKYAQSRLGTSYQRVKKLLETGVPVLFSGTPCQVAGLDKYLEKKYKNLLLIDFVCHGTPVAQAWNGYVKYRASVDNQGGLPKNINLRSKETGWSKYSYSVVFEYDENTRYAVPNGQDLYMKLFVGDYILRAGCDRCQWKGYDRVSDITLGDFWGVWDILPEMDDNKGTSLIITHSDQAERLLDKLEKDKILVRKEVTLEEASRQNPSLLNSVQHKPEREKVIQLAIEGKYDEIEALDLFQVSKKSTLLSRILRKLR